MDNKDDSLTYYSVSLFFIVSPHDYWEKKPVLVLQYWILHAKRENTYLQIHQQMHRLFSCSLQKVEL